MVEIEREIIWVKVMVEVEGWVYEVKMVEDVNRRFLVEWVNMEKDKWFVVINIIFSYIGGNIVVFIWCYNFMFIVFCCWMRI